MPPEVATHMLGRVGDQAVRLSHLIAQLVDVSRVQAGRLVLDTAPVDLAALTRQVAADAQAWGDPRQVLVTAPAGLVVAGDPLRLEQLLTSLLINAIRYSPEDAPIEVSLRTLGPEQGHRAELAVRDFGAGLGPERRARIFEPFHGRDGDDRRGLGLGLFLSHEIVELHHGEIFAESPSGGGTCIVVRLPAPLEQVATLSRGDHPSELSAG